MNKKSLWPSIILYLVGSGVAGTLVRFLLTSRETNIESAEVAKSRQDFVRQVLDHFWTRKRDVISMFAVSITYTCHEKYNAENWRYSRQKALPVPISVLPLTYDDIRSWALVHSRLQRRLSAPHSQGSRSTWPIDLPR